MSKSDPFGSGRGLVGGRGDVRAQKRGLPPVQHRVVLNPYDLPEHLVAGRAFFAQPGPPIEVEIGFGRGHHLRARIQQAPDHRFLGFEVRRMWVQRFAGWMDREALDNARVVLADARPLLQELLPRGGVHAFSVFFPDPWWKKKHHKRRVMSQETLEVFHTLLEPGGRFHFRTDVQPYFEVVSELVSSHPGFETGPKDHDPQGRRLPLTHREKKCGQNDQPTYTLCVAKKSTLPAEA